jgi:hypothetical protein
VQTREGASEGCEAVLLEFHGLEAHLCSLATVEEQLRALASRELSRPNGG